MTLDWSYNCHANNMYQQAASIDIFFCYYSQATVLFAFKWSRLPALRLSLWSLSPRPYPWPSQMTLGRFVWATCWFKQSFFINRVRNKFSKQRVRETQQQYAYYLFIFLSVATCCRQSAGPSAILPFIRRASSCVLLGNPEQEDKTTTTTANAWKLL